MSSVEGTLWWALLFKLESKGYKRNEDMDLFLIKTHYLVRVAYISETGKITHPESRHHRMSHRHRASEDWEMKG